MGWLFFVSGGAWSDCFIHRLDLAQGLICFSDGDGFYFFYLSVNGYEGGFVWQRRRQFCGGGSVEVLHFSIADCYCCRFFSKNDNLVQISGIIRPWNVAVCWI